MTQLSYFSGHLPKELHILPLKSCISTVTAAKVTATMEPAGMSINTRMDIEDMVCVCTHKCMCIMCIHTHIDVLLYIHICTHK